ncbi:hypothetical protein MHYP_G00104540 [Metynnis hypsauchen]
MKILLIFTLYLISDPCCLGPKTVSGNLGETVIINCSYPEEFKRNTKFFYQQYSENFSEVIDTTVTQKGRFSISDDRRSKALSVRISDVREDDGGVYYCAVGTGGVSVGYETLYTEIQLHVTAPGSSVIIIMIIIIVCVGVALLLTGALALIFYKLRFNISKEQTRLNSRIGFSSIWPAPFPQALMRTMRAVRAGPELRVQMTTRTTSE